MNIETIRIFVNVPEINSMMVSTETQATIKIDALPGKELHGKVTRFSKVLSLESRTMKTEIDIANPDLTLRPGMFAYITLFLESPGHSLTIPSDALSFLDEQLVIYIVRDNIAHVQKIRIGNDDGSSVEIVDGLAIDDQVVVSGKERLKEGIRVKFINDSQ